MPDLAKYVVSLEAETRKYKRELDRANARLKKFDRNQRRTLDSIRKSFRTLSTGAKIGFGVILGGGAAAATRRIAATAESLDLFARRLGVSARELQAWQLIAERFNVSNQALSTGIQRVTRRAVEAAGGFGEAKDAFRELGIDAEQFSRLGLDQKIDLLARAFARVEDDASQVRLAFKLFDTEGVGFLQFLKEGEEGLKKLRAEVDGQLWDDEERKKLAEMNTELTKANQKLELLFGNLVAVASVKLSEFFESASNALIDLTRNATALVSQLVGTGELARIIDERQRLERERRTRTSADGEDVTLRPSGTDTTKSPIEDAIKDAILLRRQQEEMLKEVQDRARSTFIDIFTSNMVEAAESGFKSILKSWARTLQQMVARLLASKLFDLFASTGLGKAIFGGITFGGPKAAGGPVNPGSAFLVGEKGPELFVPRSLGNIVPSGEFGGMTINVDARGAEAGVERAVARAVRTAVEVSDARARERRKRGRAG